jgi:transcriptional regulator with XRE-family HTH domain
MRTLGQELQTARKLKKLSLREVETATGISNPYLSQLENDKIQKPSPQFLGKLAAVYELDFQRVMEAAGYAAPVTRDTGPKSLSCSTISPLSGLKKARNSTAYRFLKTSKITTPAVSRSRSLVSNLIG